ALVAERAYACSTIWCGVSRRVLASTDDGVMSVSGGAETKAADLDGDWRLTAAQGRYVVAISAKAQQAQVFRSSDAGMKLDPALAPLPASDIMVVSGTARALVQELDRVSLVEIDTGWKLWTDHW